MSEQLPIEGLPIWARFNNVEFLGVKVTESDGKGYGVVCQNKLSTHQDAIDNPVLLSVPHALVLNHDAVREYAKEDRDFKQLLDAVGHRVCSPPIPASSDRANKTTVVESRYPALPPGTNSSGFKTPTHLRRHHQPMDQLPALPPQKRPRPNPLERGRTPPPPRYLPRRSHQRQNDGLDRRI